jgi:predicted ATPase
MNLARLWRD